MGQNSLDAGSTGADSGITTGGGANSDASFNLIACAYGDKKSCSLDGKNSENEDWFTHLMKVVAPMLVSPRIIVMAREMSNGSAQDIDIPAIDWGSKK